jgi:plastocyanin
MRRSAELMKMSTAPTSPPAATAAVTPATALRIVAAVAIAVAGLIHLQLYFDGYRDVPNANFGRSFLLNGFGSVVVALALLARRDALVRLAGIGLVAGTLIAFTLTRTDHAVFGFTEHGFEPSPQAALTMVLEIVALLALVATFVPAIGAGRGLPVRALAPLGAALVVVTVVMSVLWNRGPSASAEPAAPGSVNIAEFAFAPPTLAVTVGSTVTWTNQDGVSHSVDSSDDTFDSEPLGQGATFAHTFDAAGSFTYLCGIHPSMSGTITVTG